MQDTQPRSAPPLDQNIIDRFQAIVGTEHALTDPDQQSPYLTEWRGLYSGVSPLVVRPGSVEEVAQVLKLANDLKLAVIPQSGNTGLVGGQTPQFGNEIVISTQRLRRVRAIDPAGNTLTVDAGLTLQECQDAAENVDRLFPLSLPSEGSCRIGGNIATNAGGVGVLAYGNTRQLVMGLEVVLADGRILSDLNTLKKNNTGYDLKNLFIGSEGTLGIVTGAVLRLFPMPKEKATAMLALPKLAAALDVLDIASNAAGGQLTAFEFIPRLTVDLICDNMGGRDPFAQRYDWYLLMELSGAQADGSSDALMEAILTQAAENDFVADAVIAGSVQQAKDLWHLREGISEAQKYAGASIKHDISVPVRHIPTFVDQATQRIHAYCPGARPLALGHFGDGNVHYNLAQPVDMDRGAFQAMGPRISQTVYDVVGELEGSTSAEHGIGRIKRDALKSVTAPVALEVMADIKHLLDPNGILNPGKVL